MAEGSPIYSIGAVARMLGLPVATIRNWEERYGLVTPERSAGGHRIYSRAEVERLRFVKVQIDGGMQPGEAHRLLADRALADRDDRSPEGNHAQAPRILILLAERDAFAAELSEYFLRTEGFDVELALDAAHARARFEALRPQLAVVDLLISGGEGAELCRWLREQGAPTVLAISTLEARDVALAAEADAFLQKPLDPLQLISTVKDLLGKSAFLHALPRAG
jgi:DNA-binding transcriptional MerR regulator